MTSPLGSQTLACRVQAPRVDPVVVIVDVVAVRRLGERRERVRWLSRDRDALGARVDPIGQCDGNAVGRSQLRIVVKRRRRSRAGRGCRFSGRNAASADFRDFQYSVLSRECGPALIAAVDRHVIHRIALAAGLEIEGRTALIAELRARGIAVGTEMTDRA
ncbi:MAG TPA: hypothetical protein VF304_07065 [Casimicrobiaceae bacterium]